MKKHILSLLTLTISLVPAVAQETGFKWLREVPYPTVRAYSEDKAAIIQNGKWGYMDKTGEVLIPADFDMGRDFVNGLAIVRQNGKWGVIKPDGSFLFTPEFTYLSDFDAGVALAKVDNTSYYLYANGKKQALSPKYEYYPFKDGAALIREKDKWGYIDTKGNMIVEPKFSEAHDFSGEYALVTRKDETYYINRKGSKRLMIQLPDSAITFSEGLGRAILNNVISFVRAEDLNYLPYRFKKAGLFSEGLAAVTFMDDSRGYIGRQGAKMISLPADAEPGNFSEGLARVKVGDKYGYVNRSGDMVIEPLFDTATDFHSGLAIVSVAGRKGVIKQRDAEDKDAAGQITGMVLQDANGNGRIEAEESFKLLVTVSNTGAEQLRDVRIALQGDDSALNELNLKNRSVELLVLEPGQETEVVFEGKASLNVDSRHLKFEAHFIADNLLFADLRDKEFEVTGVKNAKPLFSKYWVFKDNHTALGETDFANLKVDVINDGKDIARDIRIKLLWPEGTTAPVDSLFISAIPPGETRSVQTVFSMDSTLTASEFTIVASLVDYTKTKSDIKYLAFESGKMNMETALYVPQFSYPQGMGGGTVVVGPGMAQTPDARPSRFAVNSELLDGLEQINELNYNRYALIIGNEKYDENKQTVSSEQNVDFALQDAEVFAAYANKVLGVPESNIILLKDATYAQMNFNINKICMISKTNPGNVDLVVYYAGHGQHDVNSKETFLIPVDVSISAPTQGIKLEGMYAQLSQCEAKKTMVFLDACYSGVGRGIVIQPKSTPIKGDMVVLTASSSTQRSMPYKAKQHGMFTYFLLKTMRESKGNICLPDLYNNVRQEVQKNSIWINNVEQTPELIQGEGISSDWSTWTVY